MIDAEQALAGFGYIVTGLMGGAVIWFRERAVRQAKEQASITQADSAMAQATAEGALYRQLIDRIKAVEEGHKALEERYRNLNRELDDERRRRRHVEDHVGMLEQIMRSAGLNPPEYKPLVITDA